MNCFFSFCVKREDLPAAGKMMDIFIWLRAFYFKLECSIGFGFGSINWYSVFVVGTKIFKVEAGALTFEPFIQYEVFMDFWLVGFVLSFKL
jgi:hypothetical protein